MSIPVALTSGIAALGGMASQGRELVRKRPFERSAIHREGQLLDALDRYVKEQAPDRPIKGIDISHAKPEDITVRQLLTNADKLGSYQRATPERNPGYIINPNADESVLAHELGHVAFGQTKFGELVQGLRDTSPSLTKALGAASILAPVGIAAVTPDEDNDLAAGLAVTGLLSAPELIDEFEGSRRASIIMDKTGVPATAGQKARMAGGLISYAARPIALAAAGAVTGNLINQTASTLMP